MVVYQPAAVWFPISSPKRAHTRAQLASTYRASCPGNRSRKTRVAAGRSAHPPRYPSTIAAVSPSIRSGASSVRRARRDDVQTVSTGGPLADSRTTPAVGTVTADTPLSASPRSAVPDRHDFRDGWRDDGRDALSVPSPRPAGHRGSRGPEHRRERGRARGRGLGRRTR